MRPEAEPLAAVFRRLISGYGPITLQHYMGESNARYYAGKDPLGREGDFVTAPEISQMFGEMLGLWLADMWLRAGGDPAVHYVELGPGRGTLARDALRAMRHAGLAPQVHLVEASQALRAVQADAVPGAHWHHDLASLPTDGPLLLVGNEFLDALPVRQLVKTPQGWRERMVGLDGDRFVPVAGDKPMDAAIPPGLRDAAAGTLVETCPGAAAVTAEIAARLAAQGGAALLVDYGYDRPQTGSTLQAVRAHQRVDPFALPGEADLTCHVDFAAVAEVAVAHGARHLGTTTQGQFLRALGIEARAARLGAAAPDRTAAIRADMDRLVAPDQMGDLFRVIGLAAPDWPRGAGL